MSKLKNLVIVESPTKVKPIEKFLGKDYKVMSSYGHIRDLRKKNFDMAGDGEFEAEYEVPEDKKSLVVQLRKAASEAETIWLASDEDREGEAIAWHLAVVLGIDPAKARRIVFHEITKKAILNAIENPRPIDMNRVDAQQARRVLDRIVGFELSPVLWKKIKPSLSAGRVQSVAVRLIAEREQEIEQFRSEPYYRATAQFTTASGEPLRAELSHRLHNREQAEELLRQCIGAEFTVSDKQVKSVKKSPAPPFTTSTLQQEASRKLGMTVSQTMMVAQRLYEAGHITYMRTDSLNLSNEAIAAISAVIKAEKGERYLQVRHYRTSSKGAQEAHEAIRPTDMSAVSIEGTQQEKRLYQLIRRRAIASQMAEAEIEKTTVEIESATAPDARFISQGEVVTFDGFLNLYAESTDDASNETDIAILPAINTGDALVTVQIAATERFTQQPPRYTEASLVRKMEELGIGRPSTYATTISTIQQREYVVRGDREGHERSYEVLTLEKGKIKAKTRKETVGSEKGKLLPTDTGMIVNDFLTEYFPDILDYNFTARVEERFDEIAEGQLRWTDEINDFYALFHPAVESAMNMRLEHKVGERELGTDPATGLPVSVKIGRFGPVVQIGHADAEAKPQFASLLKGQSMATITLEEALKLFEFPRQLGEYEDKAVTVAIGRFGPYVRHNNVFVSIPKDQQPAEISLEQAIELIEAKRRQKANNTLKTFTEDADMEVLNGRFGAYIAYKGSNYKIPKTVADPASLTYEEAMEIVKAPKPEKKKRTAKK